MVIVFDKGNNISLKISDQPKQSFFKLLFEPNDEVLEMTAKIMIADSIKQWEPRIEIENIFVTSQIDDRDLNSEDTKENQGYILSIKILFFDPQEP